MSRPDLMLAERGNPADLDRLAASGYVFDLKIDGIRALVRTDRGAKVTMTSRNGLDLTERFPELVDSLAEIDDDLLIDAEVAVPDATGLPSWPLTQRRTAQRTAGRLASELPAHLYVFDVLQAHGADMTPQPFRARRDLLEALAGGWRGRIGLTACSADPWSLWEVVLEHSLEGVIAKRADSRYRPGRSRDWVKVKTTQTLSCLVGGVQWSGAPGVSEPRSLDLFLVDDAGRLVPVGHASGGVSASMRRQLLAGLRKPPVVVEVEYTDITDAGVLRHPVVRALRSDVDVLACSTDQIAAATRRRAAP